MMGLAPTYSYSFSLGGGRLRRQRSTPSLPFSPPRPFLSSRLPSLSPPVWRRRRRRMSGVKMPFLSPPSSPPVSLYLLPLPPFSTGSILKKAPSALDGREEEEDAIFFLYFSFPSLQRSPFVRREEGRWSEKTNQAEGGEERLAKVSYV